MNGGGGGGGDDWLRPRRRRGTFWATRDARRPIASGSPAERSIFSDLKSPPPSMRRASGGTSRSGRDSRSRPHPLQEGPDAAAIPRGAIAAVRPGAAVGAAPTRAQARAPSCRRQEAEPNARTSESSSESEDADEVADADYVSPAWDVASRNSRGRRRRGARRERARRRAGLENRRDRPASAAARAARRPHRIGDSDSDDDGNKI